MKTVFSVFVAALSLKIIELERINTELERGICVFREGYVMRKHTMKGQVHNSSQTEAAPVFSIKPMPPKEGAPRKNTGRHGRHKTYPFQNGMSLEKKVSLQDIGIQTSPSEFLCSKSPITSCHILPSNLKESGSISISFSKGKMSKELYRSVRRLSLHDDRNPQTTPASMESLPPIPSTETPPFPHFHVGVKMTPPCKSEINCPTL